MRPLKLKLKNFGPFLQETIDFTQTDDNDLFLISGKTGSGKSMLFDAMTYALFGNASNSERKGKELRSHFADGKSAMEVELTFKLKNKIFKIERSAPFVKDGNKIETKGSLQIFELVDDEYELKESNIKAGAKYVESLLGVNINQFRQLFILPQGEFKKFLFSKSLDKQPILRTLFNTKRFEQLKDKLSEEIKNEKHQIELRTQKIEQLWKSLEDFSDSTLIETKKLPSIQTDKLLAEIPQFEKIGEAILQQLTTKKEKQNATLKQQQERLQQAQKLHDYFTQLKENQNMLNQLTEKADDIKKKEVLLKKIREVRPLHQILINIEDETKTAHQYAQNVEKSAQDIEKKSQQLDTYQQEQTSLKQDEPKIEAERQFLSNTKYYFQNKEQYEEAFQNKDSLNEKVNALKQSLNVHQKTLKQYEKTYENEADYAKVQALTKQQYEIEKEIETVKTYILEQENNAQRIKKKAELELSYYDYQQEIETMIEKSNSIKIHETDIDSQEEMIKKLQSMLHPGDQCPICGNTIESLSDHVDFERLKAQKKKQQEINERKEELIIKSASIETEMKLVSEAIETFNTNTKIENPETKLVDLEQQVEQIKNKIITQQDLNQKIEKNIKNKQDLTKTIQEEKIQLTQQQSELTHNQNLTDAFIEATKFNDIFKFKEDYLNQQQHVEQFDKQLENVTKQIQDLAHEIEIDRNTLENIKVNWDKSKKHLKQLEAQSEKEMLEIGIRHLDEVKEILAFMPEKEKIEEEISQYRKAYEKIQNKIEELSSLVKNQTHPDLDWLEAKLKQAQEDFDVISKQLNEHEFKLQGNQKDIKIIKENIDVLNRELAEQEEIFKLSEVLSGNNNQKLTIENYVLVYYLEMILEFANRHFYEMTNHRYKLMRSETVGKGFSGLDIEIFDAYSNKKRPVSTLSGGESFQASLALALGLSEVVQQESGGIALESIFIDEGFGTLDQETLETALDTLMGIKTSGRMVGIISHVSELKQRIPVILQIQSDSYQSRARFKFQ